jgi:hypothetical protein
MRSATRGETVDLTTLDELSAASFATWRDKHVSADLAACEPPVTASAAWSIQRPSRSREA